MSVTETSYRNLSSLMGVGVPLGSAQATLAANDASRARSSGTSDVIDVEATAITTDQNATARKPGEAPASVPAQAPGRLNTPTEVYTHNAQVALPARPLEQEFSYAPAPGILGAVTVKSESPPLGQIIHLST